LKTAFIILTYNRPDILLPVLRGLAEQCDARHEIIIADDGSSQAAIDAVRTGLPAFKCPVRHVWYPDTGFTASRARNLAAAVSSADYLVFMDGDCLPNPHFVEGHAALLEPGFFVNGSRVLLSAELTQTIVDGQIDINKASLGDWLRWRMTRDVNKLIHLIHWLNAPGRKQEKFVWKKIRSCNFALWRKDFLRVNGFDESFEGWGHEDADLVLRLHNVGLKRKNGYCATEVYHLWHKVNSRTDESKNRKIVTQRLHSGLIRAFKGVDNGATADHVVVTKFN
jgi:GT2 family glycosyltransferase